MVNVVDKRGQGDVVLPAGEKSDANSPPSVTFTERADPATELINKTFRFIVEQPEFYHILQLSRAERKMVAKQIAKVMTTFPHFNKRAVNEG
jgi:hypothetical protein